MAHTNSGSFLAVAASLWIQFWEIEFKLQQNVDNIEKAGAKLDDY